MRSLPAGVRARALTTADIPDVVVVVRKCDATYHEWAGEWAPPSEQAEIEDWAGLLAHPDHWAEGAFDDDGNLIAAVGWHEAEDEEMGRIPGVAHVVSVFTDPDHWGRGIAAALLDRAETEMAEREYRVTRLWTPRDAPARRFYEKLGWTEDGRERWTEQFRLHLIGYEKRIRA